jgi:hypothetical protein
MLSKRPKLLVAHFAGSGLLCWRRLTLLAVPYFAGGARALPSGALVFVPKLRHFHKHE